MKSRKNMFKILNFIKFFTILEDYKNWFKKIDLFKKK